jgi:hypothetical protein
MFFRTIGCLKKIALDLETMKSTNSYSYVFLICAIDLQPIVITFSYRILLISVSQLRFDENWKVGKVIRQFYRHIFKTAFSVTITNSHTY